MADNPGGDTSDTPVSQYEANVAAPETMPETAYWAQEEFLRISQALLTQDIRLLSFLIDPDTGVLADWMHWAGFWRAGYYRFNDVVYDDGWTMICTNPDGTTDKAAPVPSGNPFWVTESVGTVSFSNLTEAEPLWISGNRFTFSQGGYFNGWRIWVPEDSGNFTYEVWAATAPNYVLQQVLGPTTPVSGQAGTWLEIPESFIVTDGLILDVMVVVRAVTQPNTFTANWDVKNDNGGPSEGEAWFQDDNTIIRVHNIDKLGADQSGNLQAVEVGGTLQFAGLTWTITNVDIQGTHVRYTLTPNQGRPTEDERSLTFTWGSTAPVPYVEDAGFYSGTAQVDGFKDSSYPPAALNDNAYGVDVLLQEATVSEDWELVAYGGNVAGGGGGGDFLSDGSVPMTGQFQSFDGSVAAPGMAYANSLGTGWSRFQPGDNTTEELIGSVDGVEKISINFFGVAVPDLAINPGGTFNANSARLQNTGNAATGTDALNRNSADNRYPRFTDNLVPRAVCKVNSGVGPTFSANTGFASVVRNGAGDYTLTLNSGISTSFQVIIATADSGGVACGGDAVTNTTIRVTIVNVITHVFQDEDFNVVVYNGGSP